MAALAAKGVQLQYQYGIRARKTYLVWFLGPNSIPALYLIGLSGQVLPGGFGPLTSAM